MASEFDFSGRTALITGGATGIGASTARWLDARGIARLIIVDRNAEGVAALNLRTDVEAVIGDVADPALWDALESKGGKLDHALINAAINVEGQLADIDFADWRKVLSVNLDGAYLALRHSLRRMRENGKGSVVITASTGGLRPLKAIGAYGVAKCGVMHMARVAALEEMGNAIRVNAVAPGPVNTPIWDSNTAFQERLAILGNREAVIAEFESNPARHTRFASPDELASHIGFLLSDMALNINGHTLVSDGGNLIQG